ncbi:MAG: hypothetical protein QOF21_2824 [Actinomycetota bacterium]
MSTTTTVETCDLVAFYLPQFHPIPENDSWWGNGFTEWTNVVRATPRFRGHQQPHLPSELGFYDLRVPEVREQQAALAAEYGVTAFCYYHYWFNGRRLLERPFNEVLASGQPDFPFLLCWANESWTRAWDGSLTDLLLTQDYDADDDVRHIRSLFPAFEDARYYRYEGKPMFIVYRSSLLPDMRRTTDVWRAEARKAGIGELYLARVDGHEDDIKPDPFEQGFDAAVDWIPDFNKQGRPVRWNRAWGLTRRLHLTEKAYGDNRIIPYERVVRNMLSRPAPRYIRHPCVTPSWDNSARRATYAFIADGANPDDYGRWLETEIRRAPVSEDRHKLVFVNAWNEWAEGNHLEPDERWGRAYLEATRDALTRAGSSQP